jgi:hypothetical protein
MSVEAMFAEFIVPVVAYLITLLVLWVTVALTKRFIARVSMPASRPLMQRTIVGARTTR